MICDLNFVRFLKLFYWKSSAIWIEISGNLHCDKIIPSIDSQYNASMDNYVSKFSEQTTNFFVSLAIKLAYYVTPLNN